MNQLVTAQASKLAAALDLPDSAELLPVMKQTAFRGQQVSDAQMSALLIVANQYRLNPWTKEIYAFPDKGGIVPVVGVDGWARIINEHPQFDGMEFEQDDEACTCRIYRKDRKHAVAVTEYMAECKRNTQPWQSHPRRMLRHKATIQCARLAFGFAGIYDQDEAERIVEKDMGRATVVAPPTDDAYVAFEAEVLPVLREAALQGMAALQDAFGALAQSAHKSALWKAHAASLKQAAAAVDEATTVIENGSADA
jgi:phage recombination protein Bet